MLEVGGSIKVAVRALTGDFHAVVWSGTVREKFVEQMKSNLYARTTLMNG